MTAIFRPCATREISFPAGRRASLAWPRTACRHSARRCARAGGRKAQRVSRPIRAPENSFSTSCRPAAAKFAAIADRARAVSIAAASAADRRAAPAKHSPRRARSRGSPEHRSRRSAARRPRLPAGSSATLPGATAARRYARPPRPSGCRRHDQALRRPDAVFQRFDLGSGNRCRIGRIARRRQAATAPAHSRAARISCAAIRVRTPLSSSRRPTKPDGHDTGRLRQRLNSLDVDARSTDDKDARPHTPSAVTAARSSGFCTSTAAPRRLQQSAQQARRRRRPHRARLQARAK